MPNRPYLNRMYLQASLQKELDTVQQSLVTKLEFLAKAKLSRNAHELQARNQQVVAAPAQQSIDGRTDHRYAQVFAVPEARKRKQPAVSFKPLEAASMASFAPRPAAQCNVTSNASVASDNTSIFWSDIAPSKYVHPAETGTYHRPSGCIPTSCPVEGGRHRQV
jgi:hypothetical protein